MNDGFKERNGTLSWVALHDAVRIEPLRSVAGCTPSARIAARVHIDRRPRLHAPGEGAGFEPVGPEGDGDSRRSTAVFWMGDRSCDYD